MSDLPRFQVVHAADFDEQLFALIRDPEQADEFIAGAQTLLASDPESGSPTSPLRKVWYLPMPTVGGRRVSLFYTFDEEAVFLVAILPFDD